MEYNTHREIQEKLLNKLLLILATLTPLALVFSLLRFYDIGWQPIFVVQIVLISIFILFVIYKKSISYNIKTGFLVVACFTLSISSAINLGMSGYIIPYLLLSVFVGVIFWGRKSAFYIYFLDAVIILTYGILTVEGIISPLIDINAYILLYSSWISVLTAFLLITAMVILVAGEIGHLLSDKISELEKLNKELTIANNEIKTLRGILPICSKCKKIRNSEGYWDQVEIYIEENSEAHFSHSLCEECTDELYGDQEWYKKTKL